MSELTTTPRSSRRVHSRDDDPQPRPQIPAARHEAIGALVACMRGWDVTQLRLDLKGKVVDAAYDQDLPRALVDASNVTLCGLSPDAPCGEWLTATPLTLTKHGPRAEDGSVPTWSLHLPTGDGELCAFIRYPDGQVLYHDSVINAVCHFLDYVVGTILKPSSSL